MTSISQKPRSANSVLNTLRSNVRKLFHIWASAVIISNDYVRFPFDIKYNHEASLDQGFVAVGLMNKYLFLTLFGCMFLTCFTFLCHVVNICK